MKLQCYIDTDRMGDKIDEKHTSVFVRKKVIENIVATLSTEGENIIILFACKE